MLGSSVAKIPGKSPCPKAAYACCAFSRLVVIFRLGLPSRLAYGPLEPSVRSKGRIKCGLTACSSAQVIDTALQFLAFGPLFTNISHRRPHGRSRDSMFERTHPPLATDDTALPTETGPDALAALRALLVGVAASQAEIPPLPDLMAGAMALAEGRRSK